ncbi:MAG: T9SS type A sorting domain-containing protein [Saprospirales bacterium]|nr:T9SS type A sorting domain-containing protein [Saprospirales bacterium]
MKKQLLPVYLLLLTAFPLAAQDGWQCGTAPVRLLSDVQKNVVSRGNDDTAALYIPVVIHIVSNDNGMGYFSLSNTIKSLCYLETDFAPYHFNFYLDTIRYLNHSAFNVWDGWGTAMLSVLDSQNVHNRLNLYVVKGSGSSFVVWNDTLDLSVPPLMHHPQQHAVVLAKDHLAPTHSHVIAHEVGHYFGLWHSFNGWDGLYFGDFPAGVPDTLHSTYTYNGVLYDWDIPVERADSVDCAAAADYLCDTPPDYLSFRFACDANQQSIIVQTDPNGMPFRTAGSNFMSYSQISCQSRFSPGQTAWMRAVAEGPRNYLLYDQTPPAPFSPSTWAMLYPPDNETVAASDSIALEWEHAPEADFYLLEFGRKLSNTVYVPLVQRLLPGTTNFKVQVGPNLNYYWKVSAVNKYYPCDVVTDTSFFKTAPTTSIAEPVAQASLLLFPNPTSGRIYWRLPEAEANPENIRVYLYDAQGNLLATRPAPERHSLDVQGLPVGMYMLQVFVGERVYSGRFVKD